MAFSTTTGIVGALASLITVGESTIELGSKVQGAVASDASFRNLAQTLRELQAIWKTCHDCLASGEFNLPTASSSLLQNAIQECEESSHLLELIFKRTIPDRESSDVEKFLNLFRRVQHINSVEAYIKTVTKKTQFILNLQNVTMNAAMNAEFRQQLVNIIERTERLENLSQSNVGSTITSYGENIYNQTGQTGGTSQVFFGQSRQVNYSNGEHHHHYDITSKNPAEKLAGSLKYKEMNSRLNEIKEHAEKTFEWTFEAQDGKKQERSNSRVDAQPKSTIREWFTDGNGTYVISGKPGSGKSTFMKFLYQEPRIRAMLRRWAKEKKVHVLFHSFWGMSKESSAHNWKGLLAHLVSQLIPIEIQSIAKIANKVQQKTNYNDWSPPELERILMTVLRSSQNRFCLLIDGLDEMETTEQITETLRWVHKIASQAVGTCKICLATRPTPLIEIVRPVHVMQIHEMTSADIKMYIDEKLRRSEGLECHLMDPHMETELHELVNVICSKAQGVWIWVYHVLMIIEDMLSVESDLYKVKTRVDAFPGELNKLYSQSLKRSERFWPALNAERSRIFSCGSRLPLPLFQLVMFVKDEKREEYLQECYFREEAHLARECKIFEKLLNRSTGCLMETYEDPAFGEIDFESFETEALKIGKLRGQLPDNLSLIDFAIRIQEHRRSSSWRLKKVRFIHRTIHEFLITQGQMLPQATSHIQRILAEAMLVCYIEDVQALTTKSVQELCESLDSLESNDLKVIVTVDSVCKKLVETRYRHSSQATMDQFIPDLEHGRWLKLLIKNRVTEYHDFAGLVFSCTSTTAAAYMLKQYGQKWSGYYKGYLALCAMRSSEDSVDDQRALRIISSLIVEEGGDFYSRFSSFGIDRTRPSPDPSVARTESCISRLLVLTIVECLYFLGHSNDGDERGEEIADNVQWLLKLVENMPLDTITTTFFVFFDEGAETMVMETWWGPTEYNDSDSDEDIQGDDTQRVKTWFENGTMIIFDSQAVHDLLKYMLQKYGRDFLNYDDATDDLLGRCVTLSPTLYLSMFDHASGSFSWVKCPKDQVRSFAAAIFFRRKDNYIQLGNRIAASDDCEIISNNQFVETNDVDFNTPWYTPQKPLDPCSQVEEGRWQDICTLREYYNTLPERERDVSPEADHDHMHWIYQ